MRKLTLIALLLIFSIGGAAFAQQAMPVFCGTLSDANCAILTDSQTAMASLDSASFDFQVDVNVADIPEMDEPFTLNLTGSTAFAGLGGMSSALLDSMDDPAKMLSGLLTDLKFDGSFTLTFSPDVARMANLPASITLEGRLVDGFGYLNLDTLSGLMGNSRLRGWYGLDIAGLLSAAMEQMPDMFSGSMGDMSAMLESQQAMMNPEFYESFLSIERTDDGSGDAATFVTEVNMAAMMTSPDFTEMMKTQMQMQGQTLSDEEMGQAMAMVSQMFKGMTMTITEEIGLSDGYIRGGSGSFSFDMSGMMSAISSMSEGSEMPTTAPKITVDFSYSYSDFNDAPAITAPEDATIIPYQSLLGSSPSA